MFSETATGDGTDAIPAVCSLPAYCNIKEASEALTRRNAEHHFAISTAQQGSSPRRGTNSNYVQPGLSRCPCLANTAVVNTVFAKTCATKSKAVLLKCHVPRGSSKTQNHRIQRQSQEQLYTKLLKDGKTCIKCREETITSF